MEKPCIGISDNIVLVKKGFGNFHEDIIRDLLRHVDIWLTDALGQPHFSSKQVVVLQGEDNPQFCDARKVHFIFLVTNDNYWCQWVYQFAHEYCHHLIDEAMASGVDGLIWFEETVCELSSMFCLYRMYDYFRLHTYQDLRSYSLSVRDYLEDMLKHEDIAVPLHLYIERNLHLLEQHEYHRDIYIVVAKQMLPLFVECPSLWKIILHFGNMHERKSLTLLFEHLKAEADTTYADALQRLRVLLLGS